MPKIGFRTFKYIKFTQVGLTKNQPYTFNPNSWGMPADSKSLACWYFKSKCCWSFKSNSPLPQLCYCSLLYRNSIKGGALVFKIQLLQEVGREGGIGTSTFHQYCGSKFTEFGSGSRILVQFGSVSGSRIIPVLSILKENFFKKYREK